MATAQVQAYDRVVERLPPGVSIPPGTTGEQLLEQLPAERSSTSGGQQDQLRTIDFSHRPGIDFDGSVVLC